MESLWEFSNKGLPSNILTIAIGPIANLIIWLVTRKRIDNPIVEVIVFITLAFLTVGLAWAVRNWYHKSEFFLAKKCGFCPPDDIWNEYNSLFVEKHEEALNSRAKLHQLIESWCDAEMSDMQGGARLCIVKGANDSGRTAIALHAGMCGSRRNTSRNNVVIYMFKGFPDNSQSYGTREHDESQNTILQWITSTSRKKRYLIVASSHNMALKDWSIAKAKARDLGKNIFFFVKAHASVKYQDKKNAEKEEGKDLIANINVDDIFTISELTPVDCYHFLYIFASKARRIGDFYRLLERYRSKMSNGTKQNEEYVRWFRICSDGSPAKLIRFLKYGGRSRKDILGEFFLVLENEHFEQKSRDLAFAWCLCLEMERATFIGGHTTIDIGKIIERLCYLNDDPLILAGKIFNYPFDNRKCDLELLLKHVQESPIQIPTTFFIASLGLFYKDSGDIIGSIALWIHSMAKSSTAEEVIEYEKTIVHAVEEALRNVGFIGGTSTTDDIEQYFSANDKLETLVSHLNEGGESKEISFMSDIRTGLVNRIFATCIDNIGFADDEIIANVMSSTLCSCSRNDNNLFLKLYSVALPVFGVLVCNPMQLEPIKRFRDLVQKMKGDNDKTIQRLWLTTYFLCETRFHYADIEQVRELLDDDKIGFTKIVDVFAEKGYRISSSLRLLALFCNKQDAPAFSKLVKSFIKLIDGHEWDGLKIMLSLALFSISSQKADVSAKTWTMLLKEIDQCKFDIDTEGKIIKAVHFSIMMRRAFYKYCDNSAIDPWVIDVEESDTKGKDVKIRMGATNRQRQKVSSLSNNDLLSYLPEIVRQFAECSRVKTKGLAEYEDMLESDWNKINKIVEDGENWYNSINRRNRYWVLYWSSTIVRDVMDNAEHHKFCDRIRHVCEEVSSSDNYWYRIIALKTIRNVIMDKPTFATVAEPVYNFVLDKYPDIIDTSNEYDRKAWLDCAMEFFHDYHGDIDVLREPKEIFTTIVTTLLKKKNIPDADVITAYLDTPLSERTGLDNAFSAMLVDIWNRCVNRQIHLINESLDFVNTCVSSDIINRICPQGLDKEKHPDEYETARLHFLKIAPSLISIYRYIGGTISEKLITHLVLCMDLCSNCQEFKVMSIYLNSIHDTFEDEFSDISGKIASFNAKWLPNCIEDMKQMLEVGCDNALEEHAFLTKIWSCPNRVLSAIDPELKSGLCNHLESTLASYSSKWQECLRSDWFQAVVDLMNNDCLGECQDSFLAKLEDLLFKGDFKNHCPYVRKDYLNLLIIFKNLAILRDKRKGGEMLFLSQKYKDAFSEFKSEAGLSEEGRGLQSASELMQLASQVDDIINSWAPNREDSNSVASHH